MLLREEGQRLAVIPCSPLYIYPTFRWSLNAIELRYFDCEHLLPCRVLDGKYPRKSFAGNVVIDSLTLLLSILCKDWPPVGPDGQDAAGSQQLGKA